ncbi:hypothetical protein V5O48_009836 [Marasmius crinis-equi]|uniref:Transmembrane protein n=1 Tax=Marasmius crinis-equi TaxID=585013 RepID=A0ABR3FAM9_9AGAR
MKPTYQQIPHTSKDGTGRIKQRLHPLSLILLILWAVFIVSLLCLLEVAVTHGPESAEEDNNFRPPWALITLPTILLTVFTQAHVPVTAFHLARIAVSALQNPNTTPNSWAELLWMADQEWTGPVGIVKTTFISIRSHTRASFTYILFATACAVALVTPVLLSQAYQVQQVLVTAGREIQLSAFSFRGMFGNASASQLSVVLASWETGFSVTDMYNTSLFIPKGQPWDTALHPRDFFFASDIGNASVILPGLHFQGECAPLNVRDPIFSSDNLTTQIEFFDKYCSDNLEHRDDNRYRKYQIFQNFTSFGNNLTLAAQITLGPSRQSVWSSDNAILLYSYARSASPSSIKIHGLIQCNSTLSAGTASVSGVDRTYTNFTRRNVLDYTMDYSNAPIFRTLGFDSGDTTLHLPDPPSPMTISEGLWNGAAHYVASAATLYQEDQRFNATIPRNVALYTRNMPYAVAAYVMLTLWLALLAGATAWGYRRTFSPSLNSYVAAELIYRERFLLEDVPIGAAGDNDRLKAPFKPVGLCSEMELELELKRRRTI